MIIGLAKCKDCTQKVNDFIINMHDYFHNNDVVITSGYRTPEHNTDIGGSSTSSHCKGLAVDFRVKGVHIYHVAGMCRELYNPRRLFINVFKNYIHLDFDDDKPMGDGVYDKDNHLLWTPYRLM